MSAAHRAHCPSGIRQNRHKKTSTLFSVRGYGLWTRLWTDKPWDLTDNGINGFAYGFPSFCLQRMPESSAYLLLRRLSTTIRDYSAEFFS